MPKDTGKKLADMMYGSDQIRATPQSPITGPIANALRRAQQFAGQYEIDPRIPLLGGMSVDELLSLPGAASLMEDVSYNGPGAIFRGGNVATGGIGTFRLDPRVADVADVTLTGAGVGKLATKTAAKGALAAGRAGERVAERVVPKIMERGGAGADILSGMAEGSQSRIFVGPKAKTWDKGRAAMAEAMEESGRSPEDIWLATGTFRGRDGILRQEIDDRAAKFLMADERQERVDAVKQKIAEMQEQIKRTPQKDLFPKALTEAKKEVRDDIDILKGEVRGRTKNPRTQGLASQFIFEHPELYKAYPELRNVNVVTEGSGGPGTHGALSIIPSRGYIPGKMEVDMYDRGLLSNPTSTMLHEMQHAVQTLEGMGPGGSPTMAFNQPEAMEILKRLRQEMQKPPTFEEFQRVNKYPENEAQAAYAEFLKERKQNPIINPKIDRELQSRAAMEYYKRLAGEAEARAVQDRQLMTPLQRMETPPPASYDVPQEDLIVKPPREYADGGGVHISDNPDVMQLELAGGGLVKGLKGAIQKAAKSAGMKEPVVAEKELTTLQDTHTMLGDRVRAGAMEAQKMMEGFDYKYDNGQRVFTKDSASKNKPPYTILNRTRVGNQVMRADHPEFGPGMGKPIIDPNTGRAMRTPYEPGYRVRMERGPDDWAEFEIPESAIVGDVEFAKGGAVKALKGMLKEAKEAGYRLHTPLKPDPEVGTRYKKEFQGGLVPRQPLNIEDLEKSSVKIMPWDATSRNQLITEISGRPLTKPVLTEGGDEYMMDVENVSNRIAGASNKAIAQRIQERINQAAAENQMLGGTGKVYGFTSRMGEFAENASTMPTDVAMDLLKQAELKKRELKELTENMRNMAFETKGKGYFKDMAPIGTPEFEIQLREGLKPNKKQGIEGFTAMNLRKGLMNRLGMAQYQKRLDYNLPDLTGAVLSDELKGVPKGYVGNVAAELDPFSELRPSKHSSYTHDFSGRYAGSMPNMPVEFLMPNTYEAIYRELRQLYPSAKPEALRNMAIGALEKRNKSISEMIGPRSVDAVKTFQEGLTTGEFDPHDIEQIYEYMRRKKFAMPKKKGGAVRKAAGGEITADDLILEERKL